MRRGRRLDVEGHGLGEIVEVVKDGLEGVGSGHVLGAGPAHRDQEEDFPEDDAKVGEELGHDLEVVHIVAGDYGIDLC